MAGAFVQQADGVVAGSGTTVATTAGTNFGSNLTAGNLRWYATAYNAATSKTITINDAVGNVGVEVANFFSGAGDLQGYTLGYTKNITGGSGTLTATASGAVTFFCVYGQEVSGLDTVNPFIAALITRQAAPGTVANQVFSGQFKGAVAPAWLVGLSQDFTAAAGIPTAGGGFTSRTGVWNEGALTARPEDMRRIDAAETGAAFTALTAGDTYYTMAMLFAEAGASGVGLGCHFDDRWRARPAQFLGNGTGSSGIWRNAWPDDTMDLMQRDNRADNYSRFQ